LTDVFDEADEIIEFDMLKDEWVNYGSNCIYLLYRVDTEFDDGQWQTIF